MMQSTAGTCKHRSSSRWCGWCVMSKANRLMAKMLHLNRVDLRFWQKNAAFGAVLVTYFRECWTCQIFLCVPCAAAHILACQGCNACALFTTDLPTHHYSSGICGISKHDHQGKRQACKATPVAAAWGHALHRSQQGSMLPMCCVSSLQAHCIAFISNNLGPQKHPQRGHNHSCAPFLYWIKHIDSFDFTHVVNSCANRDLSQNKLTAHLQVQLPSRGWYVGEPSCPYTEPAMGNRPATLWQERP